MTSATLSREEAAKYLGIGQRLFDAMTADGKIPSLMLGRRRLFRREALDKMLAERDGSVMDDGVCQGIQLGIEAQQ